PLLLLLPLLPVVPAAGLAREHQDRFLSVVLPSYNTQPRPSAAAPRPDGSWDTHTLPIWLRRSFVLARLQAAVRRPVERSVLMRRGRAQRGTRPLQCWC